MRLMLQVDLHLSRNTDAISMGIVSGHTRRGGYGEITEGGHITRTPGAPIALRGRESLVRPSVRGRRRVKGAHGSWKKRKTKEQRDFKVLGLVQKPERVAGRIT